MLSLRGMWKIHSPDLQFGEFIGTLAVDSNFHVWAERIKFAVLDGENWKISSLVDVVLDLRDLIMDMVYSSDTLWIRAHSGSIYGFKSNSLAQHLDLNPIAAGVAIYSNPRMIPDQTGGIWLALQKYGAYHWYHNGYDLLNSTNSPLDGSITAVHVDSHKRIWFAVKSGRTARIICFGEGVWQEYTRLQIPRPKETIRHIAVDEADHVWIGWYGQERDSRLGLWRFNKPTQEWVRFTRRNSNLPSTRIKSLAVDKHNRLWVGTSLGVAIFSNDDSACWITVNPNMSQSPFSRRKAGQIMVSGNQLEMHCLMDKAIIDSEGRIYMRSSKGLAIFNET